MVEEILPGSVRTAEAFEDAPDAEAELYAEERASIARAVARRRAEFATTRACARTALAALGVTAGPIPRGERGAPGWPGGVVGGITHCDGYRAAAVARGTDLRALGIDAEPHEPVPEGVLSRITRPEERPVLDRLHDLRPDVCWGKLVFSAKESVYKAWFPAAGTWLGFLDARVTPVADGTFIADLLPRPPAGFPAELHGRWLVRDGLLLTTLAVPA